MGADGWKYLDLESRLCTICGEKVLRRQEFEYRYVVSTRRGQVRHIGCIRKTADRLASSRPTV